MIRAVLRRLRAALRGPTIEQFAEDAYQKTNGPTVELQRIYQTYLDNQRRAARRKSKRDRNVDIHIFRP